MEGWETFKSVRILVTILWITIKTDTMEYEISLLFPMTVVFAWAVGYFSRFLLVFVSITLHELAHVYYAEKTGRKAKKIRILPAGLVASVEGLPDRVWNCLILYAIGPCTNFLLSLIGLLLNSYCLIPSDNMRFFIFTNACLGIFNLVPVLPLDGGRILQELAGLKYGIFTGSKVTRHISLLISSLFLVVGILQFFKAWSNFSLLMIGIYILYMLKTGKTEAAYMNVKQIIYRRSRLMKKGIYPARDLVVVTSTCLAETLRSMDFDRFHFIHILDDDLKLIKTVTEQEIIDALLTHNTDMTFQEFLGIGRKEE